MHPLWALTEQAVQPKHLIFGFCFLAKKWKDSDKDPLVSAISNSEAELEPRPLVSEPGTLLFCKHLVINSFRGPQISNWNVLEAQLASGLPCVILSERGGWLAGARLTHRVFLQLSASGYLT